MGGFLLAEVEAALTLSVLEAWAAAQCPIHGTVQTRCAPGSLGGSKHRQSSAAITQPLQTGPARHSGAQIPTEGKGRYSRKKELGWRNAWCKLTWTGEAEFELFIQFKAPACINSQTCLQESAKGINLLLSNTNQDSYPMQFTKSYICAYLYIPVHSQPHSTFCLLYKQKEKSKVCKRKLAFVIKHYFLSHKTYIFYHLQFSFLLFLPTYFLASKEQTFQNQGKLRPF